MAETEPEVLLTLQPVSTRFEPLDDRWLSQVSEFARDLDRQVGGVSRPTESVPGAKGGLSSIVLTMGSAGVFTSAVEFFKAWLGQRRGTTSLKVSWTEKGALQSVELSGNDLDEEAIRKVARVVGDRLEPAS